MNNQSFCCAELLCSWRPCWLLALIAVLMLIADFASAGSAMWKTNPTSTDWNTAPNWTPETVPDGMTDIATFDISNVTDVSVSDYVFLDSMVFNPGASPYHLVFQGGMFGSGVINNSGVIQNVESVLGSDFGFAGNATAGADVIYTNNGEMGLGFATVFNNTSNAGAATFINKGDSPGAGAALMFFRDMTSAAASTDHQRVGRHIWNHYPIRRLGDCRYQHDY